MRVTGQPIPLSVVVLCHNEADNLPCCLNALQACAEVVVVDDGSTDDSVRVAEQAGARVVQHPFTSFAEQRNWALDHAGLQEQWTLHLDADEVMTPAALAEIQRLLPTMRSQQVGCIARKVMLEDRWLKRSADYPVFVARLVHHDGPRFRMGGHGEVIDAATESIVYLREPMLHHAFSKGWADWYAKHERYAAAEAERIRAGEKWPSLASLISSDRTVRRAALRAWSYRCPGRPWLRFAYSYLFRLGFLDGKPGLRFCRAMMDYERMITRALKSS